MVLLPPVVGCGGDDAAQPSDDGTAAGIDAQVAPDATAWDGGFDGSVSTDASRPPAVLELEGDIAPVHDPMVIAGATGFHLFATGRGIAVHESPDLLTWSSAGSVFAEKPPWITTTDPDDPNLLWAPHVSLFGGTYHLYYSASRFGVNESCIGHATSPGLDPAVWTDDGAAVICSSSSDNFNAIDPAFTVDDAGRPWLAFGSFWSGLKLIPLEEDGTRQGSAIYSLASRPSTAIEAPFVFRRGNYYYLFFSVDFCCQGADSTYRIMVGRSSSVAGPYLDRLGNPLLSGGGTLILEGAGPWRGPGHNAILESADATLNIYHSYDADNGGVPTLRIAPMEWSSDDWPVSSGP